MSDATLGWEAFCAEHRQKTDDLCPRCTIAVLQREKQELDLRWAAASEFVRDIIEAVGVLQPSPEGVVDLPLLASVVGQITTLRAEYRETLDRIHEVNDWIQTWTNDHARDVPEELDRLLSTLDVVLNGP